MYVVNDENFEDVKANLSNLSESDVLTISVFKNAVAGILEEIQREKRDTLWLFCFLNASHSRYRQRDADDTDLFQSLLPLYQNDQVSFSFLTHQLYVGFLPYETIFDHTGLHIFLKYWYKILVYVQNTSLV